MILKNLKDCKNIKLGDVYFIQEVLDLVKKWPEFSSQAQKVQERYEKEIATIQSKLLNKAKK
jgi:hypothetical protein